MKLASRGGSTIEKVSILEIRIITNQAFMFWKERMNSWEVFVYSLCMFVSVKGGIFN